MTVKSLITLSIGVGVAFIAVYKSYKSFYNNRNKNEEEKKDIDSKLSEESKKENSIQPLKEDIQFEENFIEEFKNYKEEHGNEPSLINQDNIKSLVDHLEEPSELSLHPIEKEKEDLDEERKQASDSNIQEMENKMENDKENDFEERSSNQLDGNYDMELEINSISTIINLNNNNGESQSCENHSKNADIKNQVHIYQEEISSLKENLIIKEHQINSRDKELSDLLIQIEDQKKTIQTLEKEKKHIELLNLETKRKLEKERKANKNIVKENQQLKQKFWRAAEEVEEENYHQYSNDIKNQNNSNSNNSNNSNNSYISNNSSSNISNSDNSNNRKMKEISQAHNKQLQKKYEQQELRAGRMVYTPKNNSN